MRTVPTAAGTPATLPDLLADALDVVFVGINPSLYSVHLGHYFARKSNRFWPCLSRSVLSRGAREGLGLAALTAEHDRALLSYGIGFTDVAKRATATAAELTPGELAAGVECLLTKLRRYRPRVAAFHGITGYRHVHRVLAGTDVPPQLGLQAVLLETTSVFLVPNPSGANAHYTRAEQTLWYDRLAQCVAESNREAARSAANRPRSS